MRRIFVLLLLGTGFVPLAAQQPDSPALFRSRSDLVVLHVNVFDARSGAVPALPQSAFHVVEEGTPQEITFFNAGDVPVAVGLVIDNSSSMLTRRAMVIAGSDAFVTSSHPDDELFTVVFNEQVRFGLPPGINFTTNPSLLRASFLRYPPGGKTALYDAVIDALDRVDSAAHQKRVLIVLSDGDDNASRHSEADMLHRIARSDALIYTISTLDDVHQTGNKGVLKRLAARGGGMAYYPETAKGIVAAFGDVARNIRRGYSIGYVPRQAAEDGEYRRVEVTVTVPGRRVSVRARDGYTAGGGNDAGTR